jgi:hypothetical protein
MFKPYFLRACFLLAVVYLSGCTSLANTPKASLSTSLTQYPAKSHVSYALPADYELPPYIRIVSLPLVSADTPISANTLELGEYWLFSNEGYVVQLVELPSTTALGGYLAHQGIQLSDVHPIRVNDQLIQVLYGHYDTQQAAKKALAGLNESGATVRSIRAIKAERCNMPERESLIALCHGTPVKTLTIAEVNS